MGYGLLADAIVAVHVAYVVYILFGQLAILTGWVWGWQWIRNPWFRLTHLVAIVIVALEAIGGIECPLTKWEADLRGLAGQEVADATFIGRFTHAILFYDVPLWILNTCYIALALVVVGTLLLIPPRFRKRC
ncbi:MAG TPA: DUF2784 family protein [Gemmataceae bacterium]|nr:DUF2784 family protein [Gemmataceae bacterium]